MSNYVDEFECYRVLRSLGIGTQQDWSRWRRINPSRIRLKRLPRDPAREYRNRQFWNEHGARSPRGWSAFHHARKQAPGLTGHYALAPLARFVSRFQAASGYLGMAFAGLTPSVARGYSAAFGVVAAYSALEACWVAEGTTKSQAAREGLINLPLAQRLRSTMFRAGFPLSELLNAPLRERLQRFLRGDDEQHWPDSQDVLTVARAIRHLSAHGVFTPSGGGVVTAASARVLQDLADAVLQHAEEKFMSVLHRHGAGDDDQDDDE